MKTKSFILIVTLMLSFLIPIKGNCFKWPYYVCFDPGHGGIYPGTLGWEYMGPGEKVHTLSACQVLDEELYFSHDEEGFNFVMYHTRKDDSYFSDDPAIDLHIRAQIANGIEDGWRNLNYQYRVNPPAPDYESPWWVKYRNKCDFFVSYHYNGSVNYSAKDTRCHYQIDKPNENERRQAAEHMIFEIVNAVQDVLV